MMKWTGMFTRSSVHKFLIALIVVLAAACWTVSLSLADEVRIMSFNITKFGTYVEQPATRILQGLEPDVVCLQEWILDDTGPWGEDYRAWVDDAFGTEFDYYRGLGSGGGASNVNGIVSRWDITSSGSWVDVEVPSPQRYFDWAIIDIPGSIDLQVVSVHLKAGYDPSDYTARLNEATNLKALIQANFDTNDYIVVGGDMNTQTRTSEPALIAIFDSYLTTSDGTPEDRNGNSDTNVNRTRNYDWIIPNQLLGDTIVPLTVGSTSYTGGIVFDSEVFTPLAEVPPIQFSDTRSGDMDHCPAMKSYNIIPPPDKIFFLKADNGTDYNLYLYDSLTPGDWTYWNALGRNASPVARDFWMIPSGNNPVAMTYLAMEDEHGRDLRALALMKNQGGDYNVYVYNSIVPGDWTYWDAIARNPSPLARDFWIIPEGNNTVLMARSDANSDQIDELALVKNIGGRQKLFIYNALRVGDWSYTEAFLRNWNATTGQTYLAFDEWCIPRNSNISSMAGMRVIKTVSNGDVSWNEGLVTIEGPSNSNQDLFVWKVPSEGIDSEIENRALQTGIPTWGNPTGFGNPQGQDLWIVTQRNDIQGITGLASDLAGGGNPEDDYDVIGVLGRSLGDYNFWVWKSVQPGDSTYNQAMFRQDGYPRTEPDQPNYGNPQARDFWVIPAGNNSRHIAGIPAAPPAPTPTPSSYIHANFSWDPEEPVVNQEVDFTDDSTTSDPPIISWSWTFEDGDPDTSNDQNPSDVKFTDDGDKNVTLDIIDSAAKTDSISRSITVLSAP